MTDVERIQALVDRGTLDAAQAERLLAALAELDGHDDPPSTDDDVHGVQGQPADRTVPAASDGAGTAAHRWLRIRQRTVRLDIRVDPQLDAPTIVQAPQGTTLVADGNDWRLAAAHDGDIAWTKRLFRDVSVPPTHLRVPAGVGVDVDVAVGSVDVEGVPSLRGRVVTGEIEAEGIGHVDVHVTAGEVDVEIDPAPTAHAIRVDTGTAKVVVPRHADVAVEGSIRVGDASVEAPFHEHGRGIVGRTVDGRLGAGTAAMRIAVGTGTLTLEVR